jgi:Uncharacterized protein conserved in bacteria (DUF2064)
MSAAAPAVLMAGRAPDCSELEQALGTERLAELHSMLEASAEGWAREVAPGALERPLAGEALSDAITRVHADHDGPLLVVWPWLLQLRREHAEGALGDLDAGCDAVLGPAFDGGLYLLGLARPVPALIDLAEDHWHDPGVMTLAFAAAQEDGLELGLLRAERALRSPADVRAALADPLLPEGLRRILADGG